MMFLTDPNESDWKLFRARLPVWQEKHIQRLCDEYAAILTSDKRGSKAFWEVEKRIRKDRQSEAVRTKMTRSEMTMTLINLLTRKMIDWDDLEGFSDDLLETLKRLIGDLNETGDSN